MPQPISFPSALRSLVRLAASALLLAGAGHLATASAEGIGMPAAELTAGIHLIHAEIAANDADRMTGLMFRRGMDANHGMLFVFDDTDRHCMWMKNTFLPLSVAFLDSKGNILNIDEMQPQTTTSHCAKGASRYALEMNTHWFQQRGVLPGHHISGIPGTTQP